MSTSWINAHRVPAGLNQRGRHTAPLDADLIAGVTQLSVFVSGNGLRRCFHGLELRNRPLPQDARVRRIVRIRFG